MKTTRLEAFSDAVIAVIITIMVLELHVPSGSDIVALLHTTPQFLAYVLSFVMVGIYWNNHHHLLHAARHISGSIMWANLTLLFWLSLIPFSTAWMGQHYDEPIPVILYGAVMFLSGCSYMVLQRVIIKGHAANQQVAEALRIDGKGILSIGSYLVAMVCANWIWRLSMVLYVFVALLWLIPDRRIESRVGLNEG